MNPLTLALTGLEEDDLADFRRLFGKLRSSLDADWRIVDGYDASLMVIDIDSIHGHMDWLKAVGSGQRAAVYTAAQYAKESDLCLFKPLAAENLAEILNAVSAEHGVAAGSRGGSAAVAERVVEVPDPVVVKMPLPAAPPAPVAVATQEATSVAAARQAPSAAVEAVAESAVAEPATLGEALRNGGIATPLRIVAGGETWVLDPERETYHGPATLKPLHEAMRTRVDALEGIDVVALEKARRTASQPLTRLRWYAGLLSSPGELHQGLDAESRYQLSRWPQIEREFPRHFRIATAMMKQPGKVSDIATASGAPEADIADFINASDAVGIVVASGDALQSSEAPRAGGMMSRIRNPFGR